MKIVAAEYNYDGTRLAFLFSTESEDKVDLKSLKKDMQDLYPNTHTEMRQIGPRDVAKLLGGMGACGTRNPLLFQVPDRLQPDLDQDGKRTRHLTDA